MLIEGGTVAILKGATERGHKSFWNVLSLDLAVGHPDMFGLWKFSNCPFLGAFLYVCYTSIKHWALWLPTVGPPAIISPAFGTLFNV